MQGQVWADLADVVFLFDGSSQQADLGCLSCLRFPTDVMWGRPQQQAICLLTLAGAPSWLDDGSRLGLCACQFSPGDPSINQ